MVEQSPHSARALLLQADRARFYAHAFAHFFRDPEAADRLRALAVDLEGQAAALQARARLYARAT
jgi:hypothetical protein